MKLLERIRYKLDYATAPHTRELNKPNEDRLITDSERGIFIVLDGVTRVHSEYKSAPFKSAAGDVGDIFIGAVYRYLCEHISDPEPRAILEGAIREANQLILDYRRQKSKEEWGFYPSTLGIISFLREGRLYYASCGDCIGVLLRGGARMIFARELALEAVDLHSVSKKERYDIYCNHPENHLSYTVFNGDEAVMEGVEYSFIDIYEGDTLFLATDGIADYLKYEKSQELIRAGAEEMISLSGEYDRPPYAEYADDKTLIKLSF